MTSLRLDSRFHRQIEGYVVTLRCGACGQHFPHFTLVGDSDASTAGVGSLSSYEENEVVVAELSSKELGQESAEAFEERLAKQLNRADLRRVRLLRVEKNESPARGLSFQEFRKQYVPPVLVYSCIRCSGGESRPTGELTVDEFRHRGGKVLLLNPLTTDDATIGP